VRLILEHPTVSAIASFRATISDYSPP